MTIAYIVFFAALVLLMYTFVGYPLLLALWAKLRPDPVHRIAFMPKVAIIVVVHNGAHLIGRKIASCLAQDYPAERLRVLVVSDGSDDDTEMVVSAFADPRVKLLAFAQRRGKAACLNDAVAACGEEVLVLTDARQALHPLAVRRLVANLADGRVGAVSGQLVLERDGITNFGEGMDAYWRYEKMLRRLESRVHSTVGVTGALYALRREYFRPIPPQTILDDVLIPMNVVLQGARVVFENDALAYDRPSRDAHQERIRKVRTLAGNFQLLASFPALLMPWRDPIALQLLSHKLMRLLAPVAMAAALLANLCLVNEGDIFRATLALQGIAYALAALGSFWPRSNGLRPVKMALAFFSLNWFVILGFIEFLSNRQAHLWASHRGGAGDHPSPV